MNDDQKNAVEVAVAAPRARKLPQARMYWRSAQWGYEELLRLKPIGYGFRFYVIGILASLRAVQHALFNHDRKLSLEHARVIAEWWEATKDDSNIPDLHFIRQARDQILKRGSFDLDATESTDDYDLDYYDQAGDRHDFKAAMSSAIHWCDRELTNIETRLPEAELPE